MKKKIKKPLLITAVMLLLISLSCMPALASDLSASAKLSSTGQTYTIELFSEPGCDSFAGLYFEISYDDAQLEFSSAASDIGSLKLESRDNGQGKAKIIIYSSSSVNTQERLKLINIKFKVKTAANGSVTISVRDAVDINGNSVTVGDSITCQYDFVADENGSVTADRLAGKISVSTNSKKQDNEDLFETDENSGRSASAFTLHSLPSEKYLLIISAAVVILLLVIIALLRSFLMRKRSAGEKGAEKTGGSKPNNRKHSKHAKQNNKKSDDKAK